MVLTPAFELSESWNTEKARGIGTLGCVGMAGKGVERTAKAVGAEPGADEDTVVGKGGADSGAGAAGDIRPQGSAD